MADTIYKRLDEDQTLFLCNLLFTYMKQSPLNTQYTLAPSQDGTVYELRASVNGGTATTVASISAASAAQAGLLSGAFYTKLYNIETGAEVNKIAGLQVNGVAQTPDGQKYVNITVPTDVSALANDADYQTSAQVEAAIRAAVSAVNKPGGSVAFASLPTLTADHLGFVYNVTDAFVTTADFLEGAGIKYPAGTNVQIVNAGTNANPVYKYDAMSGFVDLSGYVQGSQMQVLTNAEITTAVQSAYTSVFGET